MVLPRVALPTQRLFEAFSRRRAAANTARRCGGLEEAAASARTSGSASASARMIHHIIPVLLRDFRAGLAVKRHNLDGHCAHLVQVPVSQCLPTLFFREDPSPQLSDELHVMSVSAGILLVGKRAGCRSPSAALALSQRRSKRRAQEFSLPKPGQPKRRPALDQRA